MNKSNGYAGIFNHGNSKEKEIVEISVAEEFAASITAEKGLEVGLVEVNDDDPPDCFMWIEGIRVGIELVQLVSNEHKQRASNGESPYSGKLFLDMQWDAVRFNQSLTSVILKKDFKYRARNICIDLLLIHTDEPWLSLDQVREWTKSIEIDIRTNVKCVYLMMAYAPGSKHDHWPIFNLYGSILHDKDRSPESSA